MHILYVDESGTTKESKYFCVAGVAVYERETYFLSRALDELQEAYFPQWEGPTEFHASRLHQQAQRLVPPFDQLTFDQRNEVRDAVLRIIADSNASLFGVALEKAYAERGGEEPYSRCFEEAVSRFDLMLNRMYQRGDQQRGLVVVAESSYRDNLESLARGSGVPDTVGAT